MSRITTTRSEPTEDSIDAERDRIIVGTVFVHYEQDGEPMTIFEHERALAQLLLDEKVFCNDGEAHGDKTVCCFVSCNDIFAWGCSDAESVTYAELEALYRMHMADTTWGADKWCIRKRKQMPQPPVERAIRAAGAWDLDDAGLEPNWQDAEVQAIFAMVAAKMPKDGGA